MGPSYDASSTCVFASFCAAYPHRTYELLSPLAEGADRLAAEVALARGIKLLVPMPMAQREYERDFVAQGSLDEFRRMLAAAAARLGRRKRSRVRGVQTAGYRRKGSAVRGCRRVHRARQATS